jgi:hypothetical protein
VIDDAARLTRIFAGIADYVSLRAERVVSVERRYARCINARSRVQ